MGRGGGRKPTGDRRIKGGKRDTQGRLALGEIRTNYNIAKKHTEVGTTMEGAGTRSTSYRKQEVQTPSPPPSVNTPRDATVKCASPHPYMKAVYILLIP